MNKTEHLLTCLIEECGEVIHAATKALRFGLDDINPETKHTNAEDITAELIDVGTIQQMLRHEYLIPDLANAFQKQSAKREKVLKFMKYAETKGTISN